MPPAAKWGSSIDAANVPSPLGDMMPKFVMSSESAPSSDADEIELMLVSSVCDGSGVNVPCAVT